MTERTEHQRKAIYNVKPIKAKQELEDFRGALLTENLDSLSGNRSGKRNLMLFDFGVNTGLRVSDIVRLKVKQVQNKNRFTIRETKTGKERTIFIKNIRKELSNYIYEMKLKQDDFLFPSRKHGYHVSTTQVYRFLVKAGKTCGRSDIGTHTMRKTFGYWYYKQGGSIEKLNAHFLTIAAKPSQKKYIGIDQEDIEKKPAEFPYLDIFLLKNHFGRF